ncbi:Uncharacterized protein HZ326_28634 [Fusarium oxysporum f. sp. albedinis]|nr:Uncharacterized protein HZ326_28634 [Fusarium oxysporum f. sp. albedinis]
MPHQHDPPGQSQAKTKVSRFGGPGKSKLNGQDGDGRVSPGQDPRPDVASARPVLVLGSSQATPPLCSSASSVFDFGPELALPYSE